MKKALGVVLGTTILAGMTVFGASAAEKSDIKAAMAIKTMKEPYFVKMIDTLQSECDKRGWEFSYLTADDDSVKEAENIETFITQGVDVIFLDSVDPDACIPAIDKAADAGIPIINLDSAVNGGTYVTTVYSNNPENGRLVGNYFIEWLNDHDQGDEKIVSIDISGTKGNVAGVERSEGVMAGIIQGRTGCTDDEAFAAAKEMYDTLVSKGKAENTDANFSIEGQGWGNWIIDDGLTATEDLLTAHPDVNMIFGENDQMLFGSLKALENAGMKGVNIVAAADGAQAAYDLIKTNETDDNPYIATGLNSPVLVSQKGMEIAEDVVVNGASWDKYEQVTTTDAAAVTIDNVDQYYEVGF